MFSVYLFRVLVLEWAGLAPQHQSASSREGLPIQFGSVWSHQGTSTPTCGIGTERLGLWALQSSSHPQMREPSSAPYACPHALLSIEARKPPYCPTTTPQLPSQSPGPLSGCSEFRQRNPKDMYLAFLPCIILCLQKDF